jgi:glycosyltransferase involved in cell wall biosynthesis
LRKRLGSNGKKFFLENYSWEIIEDKYLKIIAALDQRR